MVAEPLPVAAPRRVLEPLPAGPVQVDDARGPALAEARRVQLEPAALEDVAAAVEDQPVLLADAVRVDQCGLVVGGAGGQHLAPRRDHADAVRRGGDVDDQLGAGEAAPPHRPVGRPGVLADLDRQRAEVEAEDVVAERDAGGVECESRPAARQGPRLVEDVVRRELLLRHEAEEPAAVQHGRRVEEVAARLGDHAQHEDRRQCSGFRGDPLDLRALRRHERAPLDQVLLGVAADDLLGEAGDGDVRRGHLACQRQHARAVRAHRAHGRVHAGDADLHESHGGRRGPGIRRPRAR